MLKSKKFFLLIILISLTNTKLNTGLLDNLPSNQKIINISAALVTCYGAYKIFTRNEKFDSIDEFKKKNEKFTKLNAAGEIDRPANSFVEYVKKIFRPYMASTKDRWKVEGEKITQRCIDEQRAKKEDSEKKEKEEKVVSERSHQAPPEDLSSGYEADDSSDEREGRENLKRRARLGRIRRKRDTNIKISSDSESI